MNTKQQDQTNYYDYGFRQLDPQLGRWHVVDAMAESYMSVSPYAYTLNDPVNHTDLMGLVPNTTFHWWGGSASIPGFDGGSLGNFLHSGGSHQNFGPNYEDFYTELLPGLWVEKKDVYSFNEPNNFFFECL